MKVPKPQCAALLCINPALWYPVLLIYPPAPFEGKEVRAVFPLPCCKTCRENTSLESLKATQNYTALVHDVTERCKPTTPDFDKCKLTWSRYDSTEVKRLIELEATRH